NGETKGVNRTSIAVGTRARWSGVLTGVRFVEGAGYSSTNMINVYNAEDYAIDGNFFEGFTISTIIKGANDANWSSENYRARGKYRNNEIRCTPGIHTVQQEGISVSSHGLSAFGYLSED